MVKFNFFTVGYDIFNNIIQYYTLCSDLAYLG